MSTENQNLNPVIIVLLVTLTILLGILISGTGNSFESVLASAFRKIFAMEVTRCCQRVYPIFQMLSF